MGKHLRKLFSAQEVKEIFERYLSQEIGVEQTLALKKEAEIIQSESNPVKFYNYSYLKETLEKKHKVFVSLPTIIRRAKKMDFIRKRNSERLMTGKS